MTFKNREAIAHANREKKRFSEYPCANFFEQFSASRFTGAGKGPQMSKPKGSSGVDVVILYKNQPVIGIE